MTTPQATSGPASTGARTGARIDALRAEGRSALIAYLPVGYPDVDGTVRAARTVIEHGVDIVELGLPYSDPVMDGPVIQHAVEAALRAGTRVRDTLRAVEQVAATGAPVLVMTYWNPVLRYGVEAFARDLASAGGAGLITPDLLHDDADAWLAASQEQDLDRVFVVAPSSSPERLASAAAASRGFVYAASTMGVTGERASVGSRARRLVADTRAAGAPRVCVGLGVSTGVQAAEVASYADGVIVGSAFVRAMSDAPTPSAGLEAVAGVAADLAAGVRDAARSGSTVATPDAPGDPDVSSGSATS